MPAHNDFSTYNCPKCSSPLEWRSLFVGESGQHLLEVAALLEKTNKNRPGKLSIGDILEGGYALASLLGTGQIPIHMWRRNHSFLSVVERD